MIVLLIAALAAAALLAGGVTIARSRARERQRRDRQHRARVATAAAEARAEEERRRAALEASDALTSVMPAIRLPWPKAAAGKPRRTMMATRPSGTGRGSRPPCRSRLGKSPSAPLRGPRPSDWRPLPRRPDGRRPLPPDRARRTRRPPAPSARARRPPGRARERPPRLSGVRPEPGYGVRTGWAAASPGCSLAAVRAAVANAHLPVVSQPSRNTTTPHPASTHQPT